MRPHLTPLDGEWGLTRRSTEGHIGSPPAMQHRHAGASEFIGTTGVELRLEGGRESKPRRNALVNGPFTGRSPNSTKETAVLTKPSPTELTAPINPDRGVEGHRNLFCAHYDNCLDEAVKRSWNSWTCVRCQLFAMQPHVDASLESYATQRRLA